MYLLDLFFSLALQFPDEVLRKYKCSGEKNFVLEWCDGRDMLLALLVTEVSLPIMVKSVQ